MDRYIRTYFLDINSMMKRRAEPFWWSLFGAGGVMSALFLPILLLIFGVAVPLGWVDVPPHSELTAILDLILVRLVLLAIVVLSFIHWAHRFRFTLYEGLQLHHLNKIIAYICYGTAIVLGIFGGYVFLTF